MSRPDLAREELRVDQLWCDGHTTYVDAAAEMTRYQVVLVNIGNVDYAVAVPNFGTSCLLGKRTGPWHWDYLSEKLGRDNARTGMALAIILNEIAVPALDVVNDGDRLLTYGLQWSPERGVTRW